MSSSLTGLLREARQREGWSQAYIAKRVGVEAPTYSRWESTGRIPKMEKAEQIAALLGIPKDRMVEALGLALNSPAERRIYPPLAEFLAALPLSRQRELFGTLRQLAEAVTALR